MKAISAINVFYKEYLHLKACYTCVRQRIQKRVILIFNSINAHKAKAMLSLKLNMYWI